MPEDSTNFPEKSQIDSLCQQIDVIHVKEQHLTQGIRDLANQADDLMGEVLQLKSLLQSSQPELAVTLTQSMPPVPKSSVEPVLTPKLRADEAALDSEPLIFDPLPLKPSLEAVKASEQTTVEMPVPNSEERPEFKQAQSSLTQDNEAFEFTMGIKWLSRIGIVALLVGLAMALSYSFPNFSKEMKILTGIILALGLFGGGTKLYSNAPILSRILQGGGLSLGYLSLFAMFFIPEVQLFDASNLGFILLLAYCGSILVLAHRLKSQTIAILSLGFGYYTSDFAANYWVAFISAGMLMLCNTGLAKLNPNWRVMAKANLLGALWTYGYWYAQAHLTNEYAALTYLTFTFLLFHLIAVMRNNKGDIILNVMNTLACYILLKLTHPIYNHTGLPEFVISSIHLGSLALIYCLQPSRREEGLPYSLLLMGLTFGSLGVLQYFATNMTAGVVVSIALCLGMLAYKNIYRPVMIFTSYMLLLWASIHLIAQWNEMTDVETLSNSIWLILNSYVLDALVYRQYHAFTRGCMLILTSSIYLEALTACLPSEWKTISLVITGFIFLTAGFALRNRLYRIIGLIWVFAIGGCSLIGDLIYLPTLYKILLFILLGTGLLGGSYGYVLLEKRLGLNISNNASPPEISEVDAL